MIQEGKAKIDVRTEKIVSKDMEVFYNPVMETNRSISILLLNCIDKKEMQIALPLAGSGVRGIRFLLELKKGRIKNISFNDYDKKAISSVKRNLKLNGIKLKPSIILSNQDANMFLLNSSGFDYIDIDPFGSPNFLLDSSVKRISRGGIIAVTATDTSALSGTYPGACKRKYWAGPLKNWEMHEIGVRILIRKVQLIGAQFEKALTPIFSYSKDHYFRVFFRCEKGKSKVDAVLKMHGEYKGAGPMWLGGLWDKSLAERMLKRNKDKAMMPLLEKISKECEINSIGFYHIPSIVKKHKLKNTPKQDLIIKALVKNEIKSCETHFKENSLRTEIDEKKFAETIKKL